MENKDLKYCQNELIRYAKLRVTFGLLLVIGIILFIIGSALNGSSNNIGGVTFVNDYSSWITVSIVLAVVSACALGFAQYKVSRLQARIEELRNKQVSRQEATHK